MVKPRRVLVTRPETEQPEAAQVLTEAGYTVLGWPAQWIELLNPSIQPIIDLDHFDCLIVTSKTAARRVADLIDDYWPQPPLGLDIWVMGPGSAEVLADWGLDARWPEGNHSEALLEALKAAPPKRALLATGEGGRGLIAPGLQQMGSDCFRLELYRRHKVRLSRSRQQVLLEGVYATWVTSGEALETLVEWGSLDRFGILCVVSQRLVNLAKSFGFERVIEVPADLRGFVTALEDIQ